jgi:hypothetical protein
LLGANLYYNLEFTEWALNKGGYFGNPDHGNVTHEEWRSGYLRSIAGFIGIGLLGVGAAVGLFGRRRWGEYVWFIMLAVLMIHAIRAIPYDFKSWIWLAVCAALGWISWIVFRNSRGSTSTAP